MSLVKERILDLLTERKVWMTRREIANAYGATRLNPQGVKMLEELVVEGKVESKKEIKSVGLVIFYYRSVE